MAEYKYYSKETYKLYGDILESKSDIEARLNKHDIINKKNKEQANKYKEEWQQRTMKNNVFHSRFEDFERTFINTIYKKYYYYHNVKNDDIQFLDD